MSCDGYCPWCKEPFNYDEEAKEWVYGCCEECPLERDEIEEVEERNDNPN